MSFSRNRDDGVRRGLIKRKDSDTIYHVEIEQEDDGRWLAEISDLPGVIAYGATEAEALRRAYALALRVVADRLEHDENVGQLPVFFDRS
jgi:predicted RNase H-like HicB family nuclease